MINRHNAQDTSILACGANIPQVNQGDDLAGVGILFIRAPDNSLFVKSILEGSSAKNSGIQVGDCLMKVRCLLAPIVSFSQQVRGL